MGMDRYLKMEEVEEGVKALVNATLKPALQRVVADSSTPYDDAALAIAMPLLDAALDKLHEPEVAE